MFSSFINLAGAFGILVALAWVTTAAMRLLRALELAKVAEKELNEMADKLESEIEKIGENREKISKEAEKLEIMRDRGRETLESLEAQLSPEAMAKRERHYVLADRRAPNELEWLIQIACPTANTRHWHPYYMQSWARPRSYLCWAPSADAARRMADSRFPPNGGFVVGHAVTPPVQLTPTLRTNRD